MVIQRCWDCYHIQRCSQDPYFETFDKNNGCTSYCTTKTEAEIYSRENMVIVKPINNS